MEKYIGKDKGIGRKSGFRIIYGFYQDLSQELEIKNFQFYVAYLKKKIFESEKEWEREKEIENKEFTGLKRIF